MIGGRRGLALCKAWRQLFPMAFVLASLTLPTRKEPLALCSALYHRSEYIAICSSERGANEWFTKSDTKRASVPEKGNALSQKPWAHHVLVSTFIKRSHLES